MKTSSMQDNVVSWGAHRLQAVDSQNPAPAASLWGAGPSQEIIAPWKAREVDGSWISAPGSRLAPITDEAPKIPQWDQNSYLSRLQASRARDTGMNLPKSENLKATQRNSRGLGA